MKKESYESRTDPKKKRKSTAPKGAFAKENCHFLFMLVCERQVFSCWFLLQNIFFQTKRFNYENRTAITAHVPLMGNYARQKRVLDIT